MFKHTAFAKLYQRVLKPIFFQLDPELVHDLIIPIGQILGSNPLTRFGTRVLFDYQHSMLQQTIHDIEFRNPIGLAAGFDKNAHLTNILPAVGFGHAELGSVTGKPCTGNPKPRLWRLKQSQGLVVYYGLKNDGATKIAQRLGQKQLNIPIGISIAKTNDASTVETQAGIADYVTAFTAFQDIGAYATVNISCPNAFGGQPFTDECSFDMLMTEIDKIPTTKPVFIKLSPDLNTQQINDIMHVASKHRVQGFICTNLTKDRTNPKVQSKIHETTLPEHGGISGKVVEELANEMIRYVYKKTQQEYAGTFTIIGCGGVFTAEDAYTKIRAGASLIQLITGMIFTGPQAIGAINYGLVQLLQRDGFKNITEAVGADLK